VSGYLNFVQLMGPTSHIGGLSSGEAILRNMGTFGADANGEVTSGMNYKGRKAVLLRRRIG